MKRRGSKSLKPKVAEKHRNLKRSRGQVRNSKEVTLLVWRLWPPGQLHNWVEATRWHYTAGLGRT